MWGGGKRAQIGRNDERQNSAVAPWAPNCRARAAASRPVGDGAARLLTLLLLLLLLLTATLVAGCFTRVGRAAKFELLRGRNTPQSYLPATFAPANLAGSEQCLSDVGREALKVDAHIPICKL